MKKYLISAFFFIGINFCFGQGQGITPQADQLAFHIANKMKDSLFLTGLQRNDIFNINVMIHLQKDSLRIIYALESDMLRQKTQQIERKRDSLYRPILGEEKYLLYRQKKVSLVSAN